MESLELHKTYSVPEYFSLDESGKCVMNL